MGFFDDFNDLVGAIREPLKDITETVQQVKDDAVASFSQLNEDADGLKEQAGTAMGQLKETVEGISRDVTGK